MKRCSNLLEKRRKFVKKYVQENQNKQMKKVIYELSERLFISERTVYNIINEDISSLQVS